jgi:hypothetical protein
MMSVESSLPNLASVQPLADSTACPQATPMAKGAADTALAGSTLEVGYQIGCGITADLVRLTASAGISLQSSLFGLPTGVAFPIVGFGAVEFLPAHRSVGDSARLQGDLESDMRVTVHHIHIKIDGCGGQSFLRSYAVLTSDAPAPAPRGATVLDMVAQAQAINATDPTVLLGQRPDAANPDAPPLGPLGLNPLNNANLLPQNLIPSAPGEGTMVGVEPGQETADTTFRGLLSRLRDMYRDGDLAGAGLGQRPASELTGPPPVDTAQPVPPELPSGG